MYAKSLPPDLLALSRNVVLVYLTQVTLKRLKRRASGNKVVLNDFCVVRAAGLDRCLEGVGAGQDTLLIRTISQRSQRQSKSIPPWHNRGC